uniref:UDP-glucuronosyltransferase n=1 Tax=Timema douglasi TaxID=61478 RepID=A0A7R8ZB13_TIMDO|nr:unnamed protein product [Timema douglasi]
MFQRVSIAVLFIIATSSQGARILGLFPVPARSHIIVFEPLMKELAARGHQVTVVSAFPLDKPMENYTDIKLDMPDISKFMSDQGVSAARPLLPNVIQLGGIHIKPIKPLPEDIRDYIDSATEGVILFSMGSIIQGSMLPETTRDAFMKVFSKLKQKVLWKLEVDSLPGQPANVKISKWLPQSDILAHPNVRVFISHGGLMSTLEASYHGVPILGIPCFGDQHQNILRVQESGYGLTLDLNNITETSVAWSLDELINNLRYSSNARQISQDFRDQPQTPMERAVFWTEYVLRHNGAAHMRSSALDLNWFQYFLLDVLAFTMKVLHLRRPWYQRVEPGKRITRMTDVSKVVPSDNQQPFQSPDVLKEVLLPSVRGQLRKYPLAGVVSSPLITC